ncbi:MAG: DUF4193 family protein [Actinomycetota bacterium]
MDKDDDKDEEDFEDGAEGGDEPDEEEIAEATVPPATPDPAPSGAVVESIEDLLAKKEGARSGDDDDSLLNLGREERLETLAVKVVPPQPTEFVCKRCYLVKHQSQLADKKKQLCRDCA